MPSKITAPINSGLWQGKPLSYAHDIINDQGTVDCLVRFDQLNNLIRKNLLQQLRLTFMKKMHDQAWIEKQLIFFIAQACQQAANYNLGNDAERILKLVAQQRQQLTNRAGLELFVSEVNAAYLQQTLSKVKPEKRLVMTKQRNFSLLSGKNIFISKDARCCIYTKKTDLVTKPTRKVALVKKTARH